MCRPPRAHVPDVLLLIAGLPIELDKNTERLALLDYETSKARLAEIRRRPWRIDLRHAGIVHVDERYERRDTRPRRPTTQTGEVE